MTEAGWRAALKARDEHWQKKLKEAVLLEREEIAKMVEGHSATGWIMTETIAARIRSRK